MAWLKRVCLAAAVLVVVFVGFLLMLDNATPVALRLLHRETEPVPVYWWLYAAFACGLFLGLALHLAAYLRGRFAERRLRRALREREEPSAGVREGRAPRMKELSAGVREGPAPRMGEPSAGEREGPASRMGEPSAGAARERAAREGPA